MSVDNRIIDGEGFVLLNGEITPKNSALIAQEIYDMKAMGLNVTLKINSPGGSVLAGYNIIDALITTNSNTHIIGLAASMAGVISQFGKRRLANDTAIGMIHPPKGSGEILEMVRAQLKKALTGRSKLGEDQINSMMADGAPDKFFDADQMLSNGLADELIPTHQKVEVPTNASKEDIFNIYNNLITNESTMADLDITNELKLLREEKEKVSNQVTDLEAKNSAVTEELEAVKAENKELNEKLEVANKAKAEALINSAIEGGKLKKEDSEKWVKNAVESYDLVNDLLQEMQPASGIVVEDLLNQSGGEKKLSDMTEEEVGNFARNNPEAYNKLILNEK